MTGPAPPLIIHVEIEPRRKHERPALVRALAAFADGEPGCGSMIDPETGRMILQGEGEEQLETFVALLQEQSALDLAIGPPQIAYRETLSRRIEVDWTHKASIAGGAFEYARVKLLLVPGAAWSFASRLAESGIPHDLIAGATRGIEAARRAGVLSGGPVLDVAATLVDGAWHEVDSTPLTFEKAAGAAFRHAQREVGILLEPIMRAEITIPDSLVGAVGDDLVARRGCILAEDQGESCKKLLARVPLANMLGYRTALRGLTSAQGCFTMVFDGYAPVDPPDPPRFRPAMAMRVV